ncbi:MAG: YkgJ family cysteine cluster protein [Myxococcota bacterium]|nr:YkgJ family cysteine cluster protein [Myxococcota bacterium]
MPPWYASGLEFECSQCGRCCTGEPGTVFVTEEEIQGLAGETGLTPEDFRARYTRVLGARETVLGEREDGSCVLHGGARGCLVYGARPRQCVSYPFWRKVVASRERWQAEAQNCPGIGQGTLRTPAEIANFADDDGTLSTQREKKSRGGRKGPENSGG